MMEIGPKLFDKAYKAMNIRCIQIPGRLGRLFHKGDVQEAYAKMMDQAAVEAGRRAPSNGVNHKAEKKTRKQPG